MAATAEVSISHETGPGFDISLADIIAVARHDARVTFAEDARALMQSRRAATLAALDGDTPIYGFNRGFGSNVREAVSTEDAERLQTNLIRSHSAGVGDAAPRDVVRATMVLRARSLARGCSAVRPELVETLIACLNAGVTPVVPRFGSVSASGDLAPLSHVALCLIGEGDAFFGAADGEQERMPAAEALRRAGVEPLSLGMKEGLALNNGCQYTAAWMALAADKMLTSIKTAALATASAAQVMFGSDTPFSAALHALRPHPGSITFARWVADLMASSPIRELHRNFDIDGEVQDPYNLRCAAQILGPCLTLIERAIATLEIEANSVTDNPIDLNWPLSKGADYDIDAITSGGHFHGMPLAMDAYGLLQAAGVMAKLSSTRCQRFVDPARNRGLGAQVRWPGETPGPVDEQEARRRSTSSGLMIVEYSAAGLANWIGGLAMPSHLFSISTDSGQEDHVSMAGNVAQRAHDAAERLAESLACELAFAAQAARVRRETQYLKTRALGPSTPASNAGAATPADEPAIEDRMDENGRPLQRSFEEVWWRNFDAEALRLSAPCERVMSAIEEAFPTVVEDRMLANDLNALADRVRSGAIAAASGYAFDHMPVGA